MLPRPYGSNGKPSLSSVEEGVGKMKAALSARQDKNLVIAGRTSALAIANLDEAVKRAKAYEMAGVDGIFLAGGATVEAVEVVSSAIKIPLIPGGRQWSARRARLACGGVVKFTFGELGRVVSSAEIVGVFESQSRPISR